MLNTYTVTIQTQSGEMEVYISPFLLHVKVKPNLKSGPLNKLYFYRDLIDDEYKAGIEKEIITDRFKTLNYVINYGQDFEKYYLGSLNVDFEHKSFWQWEGYSNQLKEQDIQTLGEAIFNPTGRSRQVVLFTPTRPSDFNIGRIGFE